MLKRMKLLVANCLLVAMLVGMISTSAAIPAQTSLEGNVVINDRFDVETSMENRTVHGWNNWLIMGVANTTVASTLVKDPAGDSAYTFDRANKVIKINRTQINTEGVEVGDSKPRKNFMQNDALAEVSGEIKISMKVRANDASNSRIVISAKDSAGGTDQEGNAIAISYLKSGILGYDSDAGSVGVNTAAYPTSGWFEFGMVINTSSRTFNLYIDGRRMNIKPLPFYYADSTKDRGTISQLVFDVKRNSESIGAWYFDDIKVVKAKIGAVVEPASNLNSPLWTQRYIDTFDESTWLAGNSVNGKNNWKINNYAATWTQEARINGDIPDNNILRVYRKSAGVGIERPTKYYYKNPGVLDNICGNVLFTTNFQVNQFNNKHQIILYDSVGVPMIQLGFWSGNFINMADTGWPTIKSGAYTTWTWYTLSLLLDTDARTYNVYLTTLGSTLNPTIMPAPVKISSSSQVFYNTGANSGLDKGAVSSISFDIMRDQTTASHLLLNDITVKTYDNYGYEAYWEEVISDNFESATEIGRTISGSNGWALEGAGAIPVLNATKEKDPSDEFNIVLKMSKTQTGGDAESINKTISVNSDGLVLIKSRLRAQTLDGNFNIKLKNSANNDIIILNFDENGILYNSLTTVTQNAITSGEWFDFAVAIDKAKNCGYVYLNSEQLNSEPLPLLTSSGLADITKISFGLTNTSSEALWYADALTVSTANSELYTVSDLYLTNSNGEYVKDLVNGGKIEKVIIDKGQMTSDDAVAVVAVYSANNVLTNIKIVDITKEYPVASKFQLNVNLSLPETNASDSKARVFIWNEVEAMKPISKSYVFSRVTLAPTIYIASDSTAASYTNYNYPMAGWGQVINKYFDAEKVLVQNTAISGRSAKSFISEGRLDSVLNSIKSGDYLFIQFAHNDQKSNDLYVYAEVSTDYKTYLTRYVDEAKAKGANPVFVTSPVRRYFDVNGKIIDTLGGYPQAMKEIATQLNVPLIDLNLSSTTLAESMGVEGTKDIYMIIEPRDPDFINDAEFANSNFNKDVATTDNTHFKKYGAEVIAGLITNEIDSLGLAISQYIIPFTPVAP